MLGYYNYTVILTYMGMLAGFRGILCALNGEIPRAALFLIAAGICDMFDGKVASTMERTKQERRFGVQIDSLSDLICFGVLPAVIVYVKSRGSFLSYCASSLYVLCALIRLAWFNVDEEERQDRETCGRKYYLGLPVTTIAVILPLVLELGSMRRWSAPWIESSVLLLCAAAFLTPFRLKKPDVAGVFGKAASFIGGFLGVLCFVLLRASS